MTRREIATALSWLVILVIWLSLMKLRVSPDMINLGSPIFIVSLLNVLFGLIRWLLTRRYQTDAGAVNET